MAGLWTHREAIDDSFTFLDLLDAHELLDVKEENTARLREYRRSQLPVK